MKTLIETLHDLDVQVRFSTPGERPAWVLRGTILGHFDAHEGWAVVNEYKISNNWHIAIRNGLGKFYGRIG